MRPLLLVHGTSSGVVHIRVRGYSRLAPFRHPRTEAALTSTGAAPTEAVPTEAVPNEVIPTKAVPTSCRPGRSGPMSGTIAEQTIEQLGGRRSVLVRQRRDHAEMDRLMNRYRALEEEAQERDRVLKEMIQLVFSHAFAEESVLWPVVRRSVPDGEELTARVEDEHQQINDLIAGIERLDPGDPAREEMVEQVFALIRQDIRDEEDLLLPRLQEAVGVPRLRRLGAAWETVRLGAPTHPHPAVPRRPPGNAVLGVPLSLYDRARDALGPGASGAQRKKAVVAAAATVLSVATSVAVIRTRR